MKTLITYGLAILMTMTFSFESIAQTLDAENTYTITGKAKRGALGDASFDADQKIYSLVYVTKSNDRKAKFQTYTFDYGFNFIDMTEDEIEFEKAKTKYKWFKYQGELYTSQGLYVEPNMVGTLVLREKLITYKYDWFFLGYYKTVDVLKKLKPKTDDGKKYHYYAHAEDDITGEVLILCGLKDKINKNADGYRHVKEYVVLKYNQQVELISETTFKFDHPMSLIFSRYIGNDEGGVGRHGLRICPYGRTRHGQGRES